MHTRFSALLDFAALWAACVAAVEWFPLGLGWLMIIMSAKLVSYPVRIHVTREQVYTGRERLDWFVKQIAINAGSLIVVLIAYGIDAIVRQYFPEAKQLPVSLGKVTTAWFYAYYLTLLVIDLQALGTPMPAFIARFLLTLRQLLEHQIGGADVHLEARTMDVHIITHESTPPNAPTE